ncbi:MULTISPECIES: AAA family ATPase [Thiomonas]|jgi:RecA-family ATPase|uniref:AAA family ATPase n=1 Tax=Thiomonas TaxID=32012 RepID=UPI001AD48D5C|nr:MULTISPECIES: AAA family ATPase [Thiomonas]MBN8777152.1 AAA family ATPase [Thiomonas arsenitoxydans]HML80608.1 AAA family ATPase [Thiomonas arsenitoxydans]
MASAQTPIALPTRVDVAGWAKTRPAPPHFLFQNGPTLKTVGGTIGAGGSGKSFFLYQLALSIAGGCDLLGLGNVVTGPVTILTLEDSHEKLHRRLWNIIDHYQYLGEPWHWKSQERALENLTVFDGLGKDFALENDDCAKWFHSICQEQKLVIVDTLSRAHGLDENKSSEIKRIFRKLEFAAMDAGPHINFAHHNSKSARLIDNLDDSSGRGSSAIIDDSRWIINVRNMHGSENGFDEHGKKIPDTEKKLYCRAEITKNNEGPINIVRWYKRPPKSGCLIPHDLTISDKSENKHEKKKGGQNANPF